MSSPPTCFSTGSVSASAWIVEWFLLELSPSADAGFQRVARFDSSFRLRRTARFQLLVLRPETHRGTPSGWRERPVPCLRRTHPRSPAPFQNPLRPPKRPHRRRLDCGSPAPRPAGNRENLVDHHAVYFDVLRLPCGVLVYEGLDQQIEISQPIDFKPLKIA